MTEKTLFEVPIYAMPQDEFKTRWDKYKSKLFEDFIKSGHTPESAQRGIYHCCHPKDLWKYNQIIGYLTISISPTDVWFNIFCSFDKAYRFDSSSKHYIENWAINGCHFYVDKTDTNEHIKSKIKEWLTVIQKDHVKKRFFVDFSTFENIFPYVDIRKAIDEL